MQSGPQRRLLNQGSGTLRITGDISMLVATSFEANTAGFDLLGVLSGGAPSVSFSAAASREIILGGANTYTGVTGIGGAGVVTASVLAEDRKSVGWGKRVSVRVN